MFYYSVGAFDPESLSQAILSHPRKFTAEEFEQMVLDFTPRAIARYWRRHNARVKLWKSQGETDIDTFRVGFDNVYDHVAFLLCVNAGFSRVEMSVDYHLPNFVDLKGHEHEEKDNPKFARMVAHLKKVCPDKLEG